MVFEVSGIKREEAQFCHACFSVNRTLWPVGDLFEVFCNLLELRGTQTVLPNVCLCWECLGILRRVRRFRRDAAAVQVFLQHYQLHQHIPIPPPLTRLVTACTFTDSWPAETAEPLGAPPAGQEGPVGRLAGPPTDEIKEEPPQTPGPLLDELVDNFKQEIDDETSHDNDWQNDEFGTKNSLKELQPVQKAEKKLKPRRFKYIKSNLCIEKFYTNVPIDDAELQRLLERDRNDKLFLKLPHRCEICLRGWKDEKKFLLHNKTRHSKSCGPLQCGVCGLRLARKSGLTRHVSAHYLARQCVACDYRCAARGHLRRHVLKWHLKSVKCRACSAFFHNVRDFFVHHRALHRQFLCDHCGKRCVSRKSIKKHLVKHGPFICQLCDGRPFKSRSSLAGHRALLHAPAPPRPELAYCVECDRQFHTVMAFRRHLVSAVQHRKLVRKKPIPCPICGKEYARATNMRAHYDFVHLKRSNYQCRECDMIFLNRTKYVSHMQRKHEAGYQPPRNKLCTLCGRGFSTNRILENHIRTHTGERPFECVHCDAKFGQKIALKTHVKHIHLKVKRQPAQQLKFFETC